MLQVLGSEQRPSRRNYAVGVSCERTPKEFEAEIQYGQGHRIPDFRRKQRRESQLQIVHLRFNYERPFPGLVLIAHPTATATFPPSRPRLTKASLTDVLSKRVASGPFDLLSSTIAGQLAPSFDSLRCTPSPDQTKGLTSVIGTTKLTLADSVP